MTTSKIFVIKALPEKPTAQTALYASSGSSQEDVNQYVHFYVSQIELEQRQRVQEGATLPEVAQVPLVTTLSLVGYPVP